MIVQTHSAEANGVLELNRAIRSEEEALALKAALEDLPGVHAVRISRRAAQIRFDPDLVGELQFYGAVKNADFHASTFHKG